MREEGQQIEERRLHQPFLPLLPGTTPHLLHYELSRAGCRCDVFPCLQEKDYDQAEHFADLALNADRYNSAALVNKGNTVVVKQDYERAAELYREALRNDSSCTEALYNLGEPTEMTDAFKNGLCGHGQFI